MSDAPGEMCAALHNPHNEDQTRCELGDLFSLHSINIILPDRRDVLPCIRLLPRTASRLTTSSRHIREGRDEAVPYTFKSPVIAYDIPDGFGGPNCGRADLAARRGRSGIRDEGREGGVSGLSHFVRQSLWL
jgi:hypothetical protein